VRQLIFQDCHGHVAFVEAFNNGRKRTVEGRDVHSHGKITIFELPGHYTRLEVSASRVPMVVAPRRRGAKPQALILSVEHNRSGAQHEQANASAFFEGLGYNVDVIKDPSCEIIRNALHRLRVQEHCGKCVVAIMAHGEGNRITTSDGKKVALNELFGMLDSLEAPHLADVRKYFFIQACRRGCDPLCADPGINACLDADDDGPEQFTTSSNFHWCYATIPGHVAYRGRMFEALCVAAKHHPGGPMEHICMLANGWMQERGLLMHVQHTLTSL